MVKPATSGARPPLRLRGTAQTTVRFAFDDVLTAEAAASGCKAVFIGFETISQRNRLAV